MKVQNMTNSSGNPVANQFIITDNRWDESGTMWHTEVFQSYASGIAKRETNGLAGTKISLDKNKWDCSKTTGKYRNQFLGENKAETQKKIDSGEYTLTDLN